MKNGVYFVISKEVEYYEGDIFLVEGMKIWFSTSSGWRYESRVIEATKKYIHWEYLGEL